jgi:hypothetical protein
MTVSSVSIEDLGPTAENETIVAAAKALLDHA